MTKTYFFFGPDWASSLWTNWETTTLRDDYLQVLPWCGPSFKAGNLSCTLHPLMALSQDLNDRLKHLQFVFAFESLWDNKLLRSSVCLSTDISVCWIPVVGHLIVMNSQRELKLLNLIVLQTKDVILNCVDPTWQAVCLYIFWFKISCWLLSSLTDL